jgi:hypothetical protein
MSCQGKNEVSVLEARRDPLDPKRETSAAHQTSDVGWQLAVEPRQDIGRHDD